LLKASLEMEQTNHATTTELLGLSLIGQNVGSTAGRLFHGIDPSNGEQLQPAYTTASEEEIERATALASEAAAEYSSLAPSRRAEFLRLIADQIEQHSELIVKRAQRESGLPIQRLNGELARTTGQLRLFAKMVEDGWWVDARIDTADPTRKPSPKPDARSMLQSLGPVVIFGASNFPLAFSVAGGDTASALAAGCPVIIKAHPAHPGVSELVGRIIQQSVSTCCLPEGTFSLLFDAGIEVGTKLAGHRLVNAVAFTGSAAGGKALMRVAADRPVPIPCFAEMGSVNPLVILPGAMELDAPGEAKGLLASFTLGSGQFCTKPGLVFIPEGESTEKFLGILRDGVATMPPSGMLTFAMASAYRDRTTQRAATDSRLLACSGGDWPKHSAAAEVKLFQVAVAEYLSDRQLSEEIFGPSTLLVSYHGSLELMAAIQLLEGHLTATVHGTEADLRQAGDLIDELRTKVGRLLFAGYPTGVEVGHAMMHGGPYPASSDARSTSVGTRAMLRFVRPVCYQDAPDWLLPQELRRTNPLGIVRLLNGEWTTAVEATS
jgi:alpha-ketoglutaric semialdehyde dehydrogenase